MPPSKEMLSVLMPVYNERERVCEAIAQVLATSHKMMRTELLRSLNLRSTGFAIEPEIAARLVQRGERIFEVPVQYRARTTMRARNSPRSTAFASWPRCCTAGSRMRVETSVSAAATIATAVAL